MIGRGSLSILAIVSLITTASFLETACSSDDSSTSSPEPFDSGMVAVPEAGLQVPSSIAVQVQGQGTVTSSDAQLVDGGFVGKVVCAAGSPASQCTAPQHTTLYAVPAPSWEVSTWTSTGLPANQNLAGGSGSYDVTSASPSPLIVVFVPQGSGGGAGPSDAGKD
jgi:hypothetical protein